MNTSHRRAWKRLAGFSALLGPVALVSLTLAPPAHAAAIDATTAATTGAPGRILINSGGATLGDPSTGGWAPDTTAVPSPYLSAGQSTYTASTTHAINMSDPSIRPGTPAAMFQTERWANGPSLSYVLPAAHGTSTVRAYFAENYSGAQAVGARVMNVVIDGVTVDQNLDVYKLVGGYKALVRTYAVTTSTGFITVSITNPTRTNSPHLMGLTVVAPVTSPPPVTTTTTPPVTTTTTTPVPPSTAAGLGTPLACPSGAVPVSPSAIPTFAADKNYCFAGGTYTGFSLAVPTGVGLYGRGSAILDGGGAGGKSSAIYSNATTSNVVINGFTIRNYYFDCTSIECNPPAAVQLHSGTNVTISDDTIGPSQTAAISWGAGEPSGAYSGGAYSAGVDNSLITHDLITHVGYSGDRISGGTNDTVSYNEVTATDQFNVDTENDVAAVGKFAVDSGTQVVGNNIHDNGDTAIWFDVFDVNSTIVGNTITNDRVGIFYEISCNASIENNTISDVGYADAESSAYGAAVRISSSGASTEEPCSSYNADGTMPGPKAITISGNKMTDNHEGVTLIDGHSNPDGSPIRVNNVHVTGNTTSGDTTSTGTDGDAWLADLSDWTAQNNTFTDDSYLANPSNPRFSYAGGTNWSGWRNDGFDAGGTCSRIGGGSC